MKNKTSQQIELLQKNLMPNISGILWITEDDLFLRPSPFNAIDYFMDGLLTHFYKEKKQNPGNIGNRKNFFVSKNFDQPFFVGHIKYSKKEFNIDLESILGLTHSLQNKEKAIIIINQSKAEISKYLTENNPELPFKELQF